MPGRPAAYIIDLEVLHKTGSEEEGDEQYWLTQDHIVKVHLAARTTAFVLYRGSCSSC